MSPKVDAFVDRHGWSIIVFVVSFIVGATVLKGQVENKADRVDVERLERKLEALLYLVCKQYPNDSACK